MPDRFIVLSQDVCFCIINHKVVSELFITEGKPHAAVWACTSASYSDKEKRQAIVKYSVKHDMFPARIQQGFYP